MLRVKKLEIEDTESGRTGIIKNKKEISMEESIANHIEIAEYKGDGINWKKVGEKLKKGKKWLDADFVALDKQFKEMLCGKNKK